ncbi:hypothetical protein FA95DRAFT_474802 [Auriscalpium vulgare]|uniref:Uncharacterized protein n=1 Tax=Auriscalpium vulgare TaxID=40419 RepID=A0ACB8SBN8_9AGAM|nr:hypothetical protein FA95DRAFT_474802 [Auriscalpium vulgare]
MPGQPRNRRSTPSSRTKANASRTPATTLPQGLAGAKAEESPSLLKMFLVFPILAIIAGLSITLHLYQRAIEPLYGAVGANLHTSKFVWAASIAGILGPLPPAWPSVGISGALICALPFTSYWVALYTSRINDIVIGTLLTHFIVLFPVIYFGVSVVKRITIYFEGENSEGSAVRLTILPASASTITGFEPIWVTALPLREEGTTFRITPKLVLASFVLPAIPYAYGYLYYPYLPYSVPVPFEHPEFPVRILYSTASVTGRIVVGETVTPGEFASGNQGSYSLRYLRAGHSLLGGVWIGDKIGVRSQSIKPLVDKAGSPLGDSIYSAFALQEAARLVDPKERGIVKGKEEALFIGLGAGISATAFNRHGIATTVIEIDPAVYNASRDFFGLPDLGEGRVILEDARRTVFKKAREEESEITKYDYVVHDCFSGGSVPAELYTAQFWDDLKVLMKPKAILAVNYAGKLGSDSSKAILTTLTQSFGQCRLFHDTNPSQTEEQLLAGFFNVVFFCSPSTEPLNFRKPVEADYLNSPLRSHIFDSLTAREVPLGLVGGTLEGDDEKYVLKDERNRLHDWQHESALEHWDVMRELLPEPIWATY